jgi:hypothetical protein
MNTEQQNRPAGDPHTASAFDKPQAKHSNLPNIVSITQSVTALPVCDKATASAHIVPQPRETLTEIIAELEKKLDRNGYVYSSNKDGDHLLLFAMAPDHGKVQHCEAEVNATAEDGHGVCMSLRSSKVGLGLWARFKKWYMVRKGEDGDKLGAERKRKED